MHIIFTGNLTQEEEKKLLKKPKKNKNPRKIRLDGTIKATLKKLKNFYEKYNEELAALVGNDKFTWKD